MIILGKYCSCPFTLHVISFLVAVLALVIYVQFLRMKKKKLESPRPIRNRVPSCDELSLNMSMNMVISNNFFSDTLLEKRQLPATSTIFTNDSVISQEDKKIEEVYDEKPDFEMIYDEHPINIPTFDIDDKQPQEIPPINDDNEQPQQIPSDNEPPIKDDNEQPGKIPSDNEPPLEIPSIKDDNEQPQDISSDNVDNKQLQEILPVNVDRELLIEELPPFDVVDPYDDEHIYDTISNLSFKDEDYI